MEEVGVQVEGVNQVELQDVDQMNAHRLPHPNLDRMKLVMKGDGVDSVEVILIVEIHVEPAHYHHQLVVNRRPAAGRIDDEGAVKSFGNMTGQRGRVAVIQMYSERLSVELIGKALPRPDHSRSPGDAIHCGRVHAVKMQRMRVGAAVVKVDANQVAFGAADRRPGDAPVKGPCRVDDPGYDLDLFIDGGDFIFAQGTPVFQCGDCAVVKIRKDIGGVEAVARVIHFAHGHCHGVFVIVPVLSGWSSLHGTCCLTEG